MCVCVYVCVWERDGGGVELHGEGERETERERQLGGTEMETPAVIMYIFQSRLPCEITLQLLTRSN